MSFEIEITFEGETRTLEDSKPELTVGRSTPAAAVDVDLSPDKSVSRKHFLIKLEYNMGNAKNEAWIVDLGSSRGTMINGEPVTDPVKISREDVVQAGGSELRVKLKRPPKRKSKMSFQEKVAARSDAFGETAPKSKPSEPKDRPTKIATPTAKDKKSRDKLQDYPSTKFSEKWKDYIDLGYQEWKKSYDFHQKTKKKATLFIMTDDTKNCDDVSRFLENNYDDLKSQILTIHTKNNGDLYEKSSDLKSSKSKEDLKKLRENANTVDNYDNPYKVIVSVLMLKEGWDVNNVTTIVGLRPYEKPKILPEQTLGRGLRKMYRDSNLKERLTVVGTPNFMEFASELQKEGVTIREIEMGEDADNPFYITSEVKENEEEVNKLDIEFPNLVEKIFKNEEKISEIDPSKFKFKIVEYKNIQKIKKEKIIWEYSVSKEISRESEFEKTYALDSYNILAALVKEIMFVLKIQKGLGFEVICDKTKTFIENYLFGQKVEFDSEITKANLCSLETRKTIIETMTNEIKKVIIDERSETIISKIFKFSEDKSKRIKNFEKAIYFEPKKSVYTKHFFDSKFEEEVNIYIDGMPDIISCIKNMGYITIPYLDSNGIWRNYIPDFFVKVTDSEYCIIETKGAELINDPIKKNALEKKLEDINKVQNKIKFSSLYVLYDDFNRLNNKPSTFKKFFEIFKKTL